MENIVELHEQMYEVLIELRKRDSNLKFTFRKSNHAGRIEEGYWFYGNEYYLAISFWTGMDWKNRTPNIVFIVTINGECFLEVNVSDSNIKRNFIEGFLLNELDFFPQGRKYVKKYDSRSGPINVMIDFLNNDKLIIDRIIQDYSDNYFFNTINSQPIEGIGFISNDEFTKRHNKIRQYRKLIHEIQEDEQFSINEEKPSKILSIQISDYGLINDIWLNVYSKKNQWIFFTGNNGSGKTNLLRGIATVLGQRILNNEELGFNKDFKSVLNLLYKNKEVKISRNANIEAKGKKRSLVQGLAMYGPYRLDVLDKPMTLLKLKQELNKEGSFKSLFKPGIPLLSIDNQFNLWRKGSKKEREQFKKREYYFKSVLTDMVPGLIDVCFKDDNKVPTEYVFRDNDNEPSQNVIWRDLPSGIKSTIALLGDILIRLYDQQRFIDDPSEFKGVVIIDEIDLHLHPQGQKDLIVNLSKTFPNIQFIVTTHSPIPLLGAPENSIFFRVHRDFRTVTIQSMSFIKKHIKELLPNQLLTSELFDLSSIKSVEAIEDATVVFTGSTMTDYIVQLNNKEEFGLIDPDNRAFLDNLKKRLNEKSK